MMQCFSCSEDMQSVEYPESLIDGADYTWCSYSADRGALWCRSLMIMVCKVFAVSQSFCKTKSWTPDAWCPLDSDLRNPVAVHHYAAGVAPSCSGDGWSGRSLRVQSPDSEFIDIVPAEKRGSVPDLMLLTAEGFSLQMYLLRAAGILLPFYVVMRLIRMVQRGQQQYRLQMLQVSPGFLSLISWGHRLVD